MLEWITKLTHKIESRAIKAGFIYKVACSYYRNVIKKEAALAGVTENDHILCVGGGICPFSAILFHQTTGAKVTVIDNNEHCVPKARRVIEKLGLEDKVRVFHQDGCSTDIMFADYSVIHLALQVFPMEEVFSCVERQIMPGTRMLVRQPKKYLDNMYCKTCNALFRDCPCAIHKFRNIGSTALYIKQNDEFRYLSPCGTHHSHVPNAVA